MGVRVLYVVASVAILSGVASCASNPYSEPRAAWRGEVEAQCMASGAVRPSVYLQPMSSLGGRGSCGLDHPFKVSAASNGTIAVMPPATMGCPMTAALDRWMARSVQPAARAYFGTRVVGIRQIASYGCRTRNNHGVKLSEHAFGNALDIAAFQLADGREVNIYRHWRRGPPEARAFLQAAFAGACAEFYTALGPGSDSYHANHFHLDLLRDNARNGRHYCQPSPLGGAPVAQLRDIDSVGAVARTPLSFTGSGREAY